MKKVDLQDFNCAGCSACANICPKGAISMKPSDEGFYNPVIDEDKCIDCGLCYKICPECHPVEKNTDTPDCYAIMASDEIRAKSSSGGLFSVLAHEIFSRGGVVCGAAFDENWTVRHIIIDKEEDMDKLRGSKYVQSFVAEDIYKQLKEYLKQGRWVFFTGVPCQVAGFKAFLGKDYSTLLSADLLCSCAPSPKVFKKYLEARVSDIKDIVGMDFRDKRAKGWGVSHTIQTTNSDTEDGRFIRAFLSKSISNRTCKTCKYATVAKVSDLTMADFWKISRYKEHLDDHKGTSLCLVNTPRGRDLLMSVKRQFKLMEKTPLKYAMQPIMKAPYPENARRKAFFAMIDKTSFDETYNKLFGKENNVGVLNFWHVHNRGAVLTNYALHEFLKEEGYNPISVRTYPRHDYAGHVNDFSERFANKFGVQRTAYCPDYTALKELNRTIGTFVVGSDQVFRRWCTAKYNEAFFLNWADEASKKIACSASFGLSYYDGDEQAKELMKKCLERFDALSLRENSGVSILKDTFGLEGTQIIDPVFWINVDKYRKIGNSSRKTDENFIASYIMWDTPEKTQALQYASEKLGAKIVNLKADGELEDWLNRISKCRVVITDSFHATCFSIMLRKTFVSISPLRPAVYDDRISDLLNMVGMPERQLARAEELLERNELLDEIDYENVSFDALNAEVARAKDWMRQALAKPKEAKVYSESAKLHYAVMDKMYTLHDKFTRQMLTYVNKNEMKLILHRRKFMVKYRFYKILTKMGFRCFKAKAAHYRKIIKTIRRLG